MIVVCGEALFDVFPGKATGAGFDLAARIGGSPFNLAVGLARMGAPAMFFGGLSRDLFGRRLHHALASERVDVSAAPRPDAGTALMVVAVGADGAPGYTFHGAATADRLVRMPDLDAVPRDAAALHVGSYCMALEPVASTLRALVERQRGVSLVAYDPNVRLMVEPDAAVWRDALEWMLTRAGLVKISDEDLRLLYPERSPQQFLEAALASGVALAVVTRGAHGVLAATRRCPAIALPAVPVDVVDTVGAGDTFQAATLALLQRTGRLSRHALETMDSTALHELLGFAARAAAVTCGRRGADLPYFDEI